MQLRRDLTKARQQLGAGDGGSGGIIGGSPASGGGGARSRFWGGGGNGSPLQMESGSGPSGHGRSYRDEMFIRDLAEKDYHLVGQLEE